MVTMYWLLRPWRHAFDFSGRSPRREYWLFVLQFYVLVLIPVLVLAFGGDQKGAMSDGTIGTLVVILTVTFLASIVPGFAVAVRRLHDSDKSGILLLLGFVPGIGGLIILFFVLLPGDAGDNIYGPDPRDREAMAGVSEVFE